MTIDLYIIFVNCVVFLFFSKCHYLRPFSTTNNLFRLRKYFNYQRLLTSKYNYLKPMSIITNAYKFD